jgi:hypothetical protein
MRHGRGLRLTNAVVLKPLVNLRIHSWIDVSCVLIRRAAIL